MQLQFEWDEQKALANERKHQVSFLEACTVFYDPLAYIFDDVRHSTYERREIIIGQSGQQRLLLACFTELDVGVIRIFSARCATKREQKNYEENRY